jgi:hypothetical protein
VLEWLWFLNSHPETVYKLMYGDKDTFRLAFHLAGKAGAYQQARTCPHRARTCLQHACTSPHHACMTAGASSIWHAPTSRHAPACSMHA